MKLLWASVAIGILPSVQAHSSGAPVYIFEHHSRESTVQQASLSPEVAKLVLAQRLEIAQYHKLSTITDGNLHLVDQYGGPRPAVFASQASNSSPKKLLIMVEGVQDPELLIAESSKRVAFEISDPPTSKENDRLLREFFSQKAAGRCSHVASEGSSWVGSVSTMIETEKCPAILSEDAGTSQVEASAKLNSRFASMRFFPFDSYGQDMSSVVYLSILEDVIKSEGPSSKLYRDTVKYISRTIGDLQVLAERGEQDSVVVLMPPSHHIKHSADPYGMPSHIARDLGSEASTEEEFLSAIKDAESSSTTGQENDFQSQNVAMAPTGIIPVCHASYSDCVSATGNCTGHGSCFRKYSSGGADCYTCGCTPSVHKNSDGSKKTTIWAGSACQKKDVSMPFWLLAGFSVTMTGVIAWAIGLIYSMGNDQLPSVLGAGVAPRSNR